MSSIDERVVEMQFDNDQFESGIKQSTDSLDKFKNSLDLDGASKGLDNVSKAVSQFTMDGVTTAVETSSHSFSALETVATSALVTITSQAVQAGEQLLESLSIDQITAGYDKYTQKLSNVQTIMNSTGDDVETVNGYMDHLMWYSDETSYGFTDMTTALANMVSTGGDVETLIPMIEGVANATAYAGQNAQSFSTVISAINSAYSRGYMQATDWKRIQYQSAASKDLQLQFIETAEALGKLEEGSVTLENFASSLANGDTAGWLDTEVMEQTFGVFSEMTEKAYELIDAGVYDTATEAYAALEDQYGDLAVAAAEAAQKAKTFQEAIDATTDAVSSKWSAAMQTIFGDYNQATQLWTDVSEELYDAFAEPIQGLADMLSEAFGGESAASAFDEVSKQVENTGVSFEDFRDTLNTVMGEEGFGTLIRETGSVKDAFDSLDMETRSRLTSEAIDKLCGSTTAAGMSMDELEDVARRVWRGDFGNGEERVQALTEAGYDYEVVQAAVNQLINEGAINFDEYSDAELEAMGYSEETIAALRELQDSMGDTGSAFHKALSGMTSDGMTGFEALWGGIWNLKDIFVTVCDAIGAAWRDVFPAITADQIRNALLSFYETTKSALSGVEGAVTNIQRVFRGLFSILATGKDILVSVATAGFNVLKKAVSNCNIDILGILGNVGDLIYAFRNWFTENKIAQKITDGLTNAFTNLWKGLITLKDNFLQLPIVQSILSNVTKSGTSALKKLEEAFPKTTNVITHFIKNFKGMENLNFASIIRIFKTFGQELKTNLADMFPKASAAVTDFKNKILELPVVQSVIKTVTKFGNSLYESFKKAFPGTAAWIDAFIAQFKHLGKINFKFLGHAFENFGKEIKENLVDAFPETSSAITNFVNKFKEDFSSITFSDIVGIFTAFKNDLVKSVNDFINNNEFLSGIRNSLTSFFESFKQAISSGLESIGIDFDSFIETLSGFKDKVVGVIEDVLKSLGLMQDEDETEGMYALAEPLEEFNNDLVGLHLAAEKVTTPLQSLSETLSSFKDAVLTGISNFFNMLGNINVGKIISVASAVVVLIGAFKLISSILNISGAITNITKSFRDMTSAFKMNSFGTTMLEIAGAIGILAVSLIALAQLPTDKLLESAGVIVAVVGVLTVLTKLTGNAVTSGLGNLGTLAGVAIAILAVAEAFNMLGDVKLNESTVTKIGIIAAVIVGLTAAVKIINKSGGTLKGGIGNMAQIIGLAISLKLVISSLEDLTKIHYTAGDILALVGIFAALTAAMKVLSGVTGGWASIGSAATLLAIPLAMKLMLSALDDIADYDTNKLLDSIENFVIILGEMAGMAVVSRIAGSGGASMLAMAASVLVMAGAIAMLGNLDENSMENGLAAVEMLILTMGTMSSLFALVNKIPGGGSGATTLLAMAAAIAVMAVAVAGLSMIDPNSLDNATVAMTELMGVFSIMEGFSAFTKFSNVGGIISLVAAIAAIGLALGGLSTLDPANVSNAADAMSELVSMFAVMETLSAFTKSASVGSILSLAAVIGVIGVVLGLLANLTDPGDVASIADSLSQCMNSFSIALVACSAAGAIGAAAGVGLTALLPVIGILAAVFVALVAVGAALNEFPEVKGKVLDAIETVGEIFGALAGGFLGEIISSVASSLAGAAEELATVSTALAPLSGTLTDLSSAFSNVDEETISKIDTFVGIILKLSAAELLDAITSFISGSSSFADLGTGLDSLADAMQSFGDKCTELNADGIDTGLDAIDKLNTAQKSLQKVGGIADVMGTHEWSSLSDGLDDLGEAMSGFAESMNGVVIEESSITAITNLANAQNSIEKVGGIADVMGTHEWSTLSTGLIDMGAALTGFSVAVSYGGGIDETSMTTAINALSTLADAQGKVEKSGGVIQDLVGETDWSTLSSGLIDMGAALAGFSAAVSYGDGIDVENVTNAITAISALADAQSNIEKSGGLLNKLFGDSDWSTLSTDLDGLGKGLVDLSTAGTSLNLEAIDKSVQAIESVSNLGAITTGYGGSYDWLVANLGTLGTAISSFGSEISSVTWPDNIDQLSEMLVSIGDASKDVSDMNKGGKLPKVLENVGPALVTFAGLFEGVTIPDLSELTAMTSAIGDASKAVKGMDQTQLSTILDNVGTSLAGFATTMQDVEIPDMSELTSLVNSISKASERVQGMNTFQLSTILDNVKESLTGFSDIELPKNSDEIASVIQSISDACSVADGVNTDDISSMFTSLTDAVSAFDNFEFPDISDSLTQFIESITSVDDWPTDFSNVSECATALQTACDAFEDFTFPDISEDIATFTESFSTDTWPTEFPDITASATALETACTEFTTITFPDISESIGAFIESISSDSWPTSFPDISASATAMETACKEFESIEFPSIAKDIADFITSLSLASWPLSYPSVDASATALQTAIDQFGTISFPSTDTLTNFATTLSSAMDGAGDAGGQAMIDALLSYEGKAGDAGTSLIKDTADGMKNTVGSVTSACKSICDAAVSVINSYQGSFSSAGASLIRAMASGISGAVGSVTGAVGEVCRSAVNATNGYNSSMYNAGLNMAQGYANGIAAGTNAAINAAANMAAQAIKAVNDAQASASPSRVTYKSGMWFDQGYANGIAKFIPLIKTAAVDAANTAVDSLSGEMDSMANLISDEMNLNPVITPVLDLSQVRSGAASLNGMLLTTPNLTIDTNQVARTSGSVSAFRSAQMNSNSDLLEAIQGLSGNFGESRGDTYNINGISYDEGSEIADAVKQLVRASMMSRRV